jgi:hypothetical protein
MMVSMLIGTAEGMMADGRSSEIEIAIPCPMI